METRRKRGSEHSWGEGVIQADPEVGGDLVRNSWSQGSKRRAGGDEDGGARLRGRGHGAL